MGSWTNEFEQYCEFCKKVTEHTSSNDNDDTGTHTFCNECEKENWNKEKQQAYEFKEKVYEIAFGDDAINRDFDESEVLEKLQMHEKNSFKVEDLDESEGFVESDIIKLGGKKYKVHFEDEKLFLRDEDEVNFNSYTNAEKWFDNYLEKSDRELLHRELDLKIAYPAHFDDLLAEDQAKVKQSLLKEELQNCSNCKGKGWYLGDINPAINEYGEIECEVCKGTGVKEE